MKVCTKCKRELAIDRFAKKNDGLQPYCKDCSNAYHKEHYIANKKDYIEKADKFKKKKRQKISETKAASPCADCKQFWHFSQLDYDHLDSESKSFNIGKFSGLVSQATLDAEIAKCEVVCANCHRLRTWRRSNGLCIKTGLPRVGLEPTDKSF